MTVVSLRPATERGGTLVLVFALTARLLHPTRITLTTGVSLTKAIEIQYGDEGLSSACTVYAPTIHIRIAITQTTPSPRSASLEYPNPTHMPNTLVILETTAEPSRATTIGRRSLTVAAVVAKKRIIRVKARIVGKKTPEVPGMINTMRAANSDITRRDHIQRPKRSCQIITLP